MSEEPDPKLIEEMRLSLPYKPMPRKEWEEMMVRGIAEGCRQVNRQKRLNFFRRLFGLKPKPLTPSCDSQPNDKK